jgi:Tfp pilus assembly protein PilN
MINLIPNQDKKNMAKNFYLRLTALSFGMFGICVLFATASMLPAYFMSLTKKNFAEIKLETQKNEVVPAPDQQSLATIKSLNLQLSLIENVEKNKFYVSQRIIQEIISQKMSDIKISQISYQIDPIKGKTVNITGFAPSRERLFSFQQALQADTNFKSVDLPISNFLKNTDIQFNLVLTLS